MAKFLSTTGTNYHLEELIKGASDRLILISPFLKLNDRMKELLADKNRLKIDVRIVYGKSELQPQEIEWLRGLKRRTTISHAEIERRGQWFRYGEPREDSVVKIGVW